MDLSKYRKLIVAALGFAALIAKDIFGIEIGDDVIDKIVNAGVALSSVYGVYIIRNRTTVAEAKKSADHMV